MPALDRLYAYNILFFHPDFPASALDQDTIFFLLLLTDPAEDPSQPFFQPVAGLFVQKFRRFLDNIVQHVKRMFKGPVCPFTL